MRTVRVVGAIVGLVTVTSGVVGTQVAGAATDDVTTCASSGAGSFPAVVAGASAGDTVAFTVSCSPASPISLTGTVDIAVDLTIDGQGSSTDAVSNAASTAILHVASGVTASVSGLTIEEGFTGIHNAGTLTVTTSVITNDGPGIVNNGTLDLTDSTLSDNIVGAADNAFGGGGIFNDGGNASVTDSTLLDNAAANGLNGGGIYNNGGSVTVTGSTLTGNNTGDGFGGAIYNDGGTFTITTSTLAGNSAVDNPGGAIDNNRGSLTVTDSTLTRNTSFYSADGGGIYNLGSLTLSNSTLSGNGAKYGGLGGNIFNGGTASLAATIVAKASAGGDCSGSITDGGYNLDDDGSCGLEATTDLSDAAADLDTRGLEANGGPTETIALQSSSPAIGAVNNAPLCSAPDQRGVARPTPCDMGAVEFVLPPQKITSADSATATVGSSFSFMVTTMGVPLPSITKKGKLPKHVTFVNRHDGTALISGSPTKAGIYPFTIDAIYGTGKTAPVVKQPFTLTVAPAP